MKLSTVDTNHGQEEFLKTVSNLLKSIAVALSVSALIAIASVIMWERPYSTDRLVDFLTYRYSWATWNHDATISLVAELTPVVTSVLTIAIMGRVIERASTRGRWIFTSILVVITAFTPICILLLFVIISSIMKVLTEPFTSFVFDPPTLEFWYYFIAFCFGLALATQTHPHSRSLRILVASLMAAVIGGVLELILLRFLLMGW